MEMTNQFKKYIVTLILGLYGAVLLAQTGNGNVQGTIVDENGMYVPGATILIKELNKGAISDFDGKFVLLGVPEGDYNLLIQYLGYEDIEEPVTVVSGETASFSLTMSSKSLLLDGVEVLGYGLGGQSRALNTQKNNTNITNVVSTEQIGKFPDANIGDAVKRIPGITMQVDQGEARNIIVRGLAPQLNSVTLNGSRVPSAEADNRNVQMDLIPSDMIQSIEVNKAVTPDMDADALGGSVNLITRSSPKDFRLSATLGSGINFISDKRILNGSFLVGDRTNNGKFGWMLSASINDNDFGSDNVEAEWTDEFEYNTGNVDEEGEPVLEEVAVNPYTNVFEQRTYIVQRVRRSFSANMDYKFNENNTIFLKTMYNWRDDRENRFRNEYEILDGEDIAAEDFTVVNGNLTRFPVESKKQTKGGIAGGRTKNARLEDQRMQNYTLGGDHLFGDLKFEWMGSYARASEKRPNERYLEYESEFSINNDVNTEYPLFTAVDAADLAPANYEFGELTEEHQFTEEEDVNIFANFELPADFFGQGDGIVKFGVRGRFKNKNRDNDFYEYAPVSGMETLADVPTHDYTNPDFGAGSKYRAGIFATPTFLGSLDVNNTALFEGEQLPEEFLTSNFDVSESVYAAYIMANQKLTEDFSVLVGLRVENTQIESTGNEVVFNEDGDFDGSTEVNDESSYTNIMPGVHFKYDVNNSTILRFAWTNTLARPNYVDLVPYREVNNEDEEINLGNAELDPATSMNFDFMAEHYFRSVGIISGGVFYKSIQDFTYTYVSENEDGYEVYQPLNGDNASIFGAEFSFQRQLDFLPGFLQNLGVYLNYTYLNSNAEGIRNEDGDERGDLDLPGSTPNMFNASLSYGDKRFSARLSANFSDAYLDELGGNDFEDRYYDKQFFMDFNASYAINRNFSLYMSLNNITDQPLRYYQGVKNRTMQMEYYKQRLTFGLKYDLF